MSCPDGAVVVPVPPYAIERVPVADTSPFIAWSGPVSVPMVAVPVKRFVELAYDVEMPVVDAYAEVKRLRSVASPTFETENNVVVALAVDDPMAKSTVFVSPLFAWTDSFAKGDVEPTLRIFEKYDLPNTSRMLSAVDVELRPMITTSETSVG
jgi:hypothetical protein